MVFGRVYPQRPIHASAKWSHVVTTAKEQSEGPLAFKPPCLVILLEQGGKLKIISEFVCMCDSYWPEASHEPAHVMNLIVDLVFTVK